jgi:AraC-like DNA-binding protein
MPTKYQEYLPHKLLQEYIKCFWALERDYVPGDDLEEVLPDTFVELIFNFGSPYLLEKGSELIEIPKIYFVGLLQQPLRFHAHGVVNLIAIRFYAWGVLQFFESAHLADATTLERDSEWQQLASKIEASILAGDPSTAVADLEAFLLKKALTLNFETGLLRAAAKLLYHTKGRFSIAALADYCHLSIRQLQRQFSTYTGFSPKLFARAIRFEEIRLRLMFNPDTNLTDLALEFGYNHQSHFINDFKAFTHKTPGEYAAEMRALQTVFHDHDHVVFLQAPPPAHDYNEDDN